MASVQTSKYGGRYLKLTVNVESQSIANNTSTLRWTLESLGGSADYYTIYNWAVVVNGQTIYKTQTTGWSSYKFPAAKGSEAGTITVSHNADGTHAAVSFTLSGCVYYNQSNDYTGSVSLPTIARQANISSAPDFNDEANPTITYTNSAGTSVSSLQACISLTGSTDDIAYRDINKTGTLSYTFNLTDAERKVLRQACTTANSRTVMFFIRTIISGNTFYSTSTKTLTIVNNTPTFVDSQLTYADTNDVVVEIATGNNQKIVRNVSTLTAYLTAATALKEATISRYEITFNGTTKSYTTLPSSISFGTQNVTADSALSATVYDSRGNSKTISKTVSVINYIPLTISALFSRVQPTTGEVQVSYSGNFFNGNFGLKDNELVVYYRYKVHSDESEYGDWIILDTVPSGNTYSGEELLGDSFDYKTAYDFQIQVQDTFSRVTPGNQVVTKGVPVYWWDDDEFNIEVAAHANNGLYILDGEDYVDISGVIATTLFEDSDGKNTGVTLNDSVDNYKYVEIFYRDNDSWYSSTKVHADFPKTVSLVSIYENDSYLYFKSAGVKLSGTSLSFTHSSETRIGNNVSTVHSSSSNIYITKVIGYKV